MQLVSSFSSELEADGASVWKGPKEKTGDGKCSWTFVSVCCSRKCTVFTIIAEAFFVASVTVALSSNMGVGISVDPSMPLRSRDWSSGTGAWARLSVTKKKKILMSWHDHNREQLS